MERLKTIAGGMYSGKTDHLITDIVHQEIAKKNVKVFKPAIDDRWEMSNKIASRAGAEHAATPIKAAREILQHIDASTQVVAIDEVQFLDPEIVDVVEILQELDIAVFVAGLPTDFRYEPFGQMPILMAKADEVERLTAICTYESDGEVCGHPATRTQRLVDGVPANYHDPIVLVGDSESYEARCREHQFVPGKPDKSTKLTRGS